MDLKETEALLARTLATGEPDAPTVVIGRKRLELLQQSEAELARLRGIVRTMSPGPFQWGIIKEGPTQEAWVTENLRFGAGDCHLIFLPTHAQTKMGDDLERPEHVVTLALTGNGPKSRDNAHGLIEILTALSTTPEPEFDLGDPDKEPHHAP